MLQVILKESIPGLGATGELVRVSPGYARNFLFPNGKAIIATVRNVHEIQHQQMVYGLKLAKEKNAANEIGKKLKALTVNFTRKAGENDKLYGSVTNQEIAEALGKQGFTIDRRQIEIAEPIRKVGVHTASARLHPEVSVEFKVWVEADAASIAAAKAAAAKEKEPTAGNA